MKKIAAMMLGLMLIVPCFSMVSRAASGKIQFTDPSTKTGETVEVTCAVKSDTTALEDVSVTVKYDTDMLKLTGGDAQDAGDGLAKYAGTGSDTTLRFKMQFTALKAGTAKVEVSEYKVFLATNEQVTCQQGYATVTIAQGTKTADEPAATTPGENSAITTTVNGVEYTVAKAVPSSVVPAGYSETTITLEGEEIALVKKDDAEIYLGYLTDAEGNGRLFLYFSEDASFAPYEEIQISDSTSIILLSDASAITMPEEYAKINLTVNGQDYPAWQSSENIVNYVLYAMNNSGEVSLYQYDSGEGTYQRFQTPEVVEAEPDHTAMSGLKEMVNNNFTYMVLLTVILLTLGLVLVIVLGVKLHNRNLELDDLYDEYGIDLEEEDVKKPSKEEDDEIEYLSDEDYAEIDDYVDQELQAAGREEADAEEELLEEEPVDEEALDEPDDLQEAEESEEEPEDREEDIPEQMKKTDSDFEDFDFDLIDLDDFEL